MKIKKKGAEKSLTFFQLQIYVSMDFFLEGGAFVCQEFEPISRLTNIWNLMIFKTFSLRLVVKFQKRIQKILEWC